LHIPNFVGASSPNWVKPPRASYPHYVQIGGSFLKGACEIWGRFKWMSYENFSADSRSTKGNNNFAAAKKHVHTKEIAWATFPA
jgi:hypothetical protein